MARTAGTAAVSAPPTDGDAKRLAHAARQEKKRLYMAAKYADPVWAAAKRASVLARYHERVPDARWGVRGRRPAAPLVTAPTQEELDDAASAASTPRGGGVPAAAAILAGAALGAAVAAML